MKIILLVGIILIPIFSYGVEISDKLLSALAKVESNNNPTAVGDSGRAVGIYQIWQIYVDDVNSTSKEKFSYEDRSNIIQSQRIVRRYLMKYGKRYERLTGKQATCEILAKIHNGGPNGWLNPTTEKYWEKVKRVLK